jgi:hypothetical protein
MIVMFVFCIRIFLAQLSLKIWLGSLTIDEHFTGEQALTDGSTDFGWMNPNHNLIPGLEEGTVVSLPHQERGTGKFDAILTDGTVFICDIQKQSGVRIPPVEFTHDAFDRNPDILIVGDRGTVVSRDW